MAPIYEPNPTYAPVGGTVQAGWEAACVRLPGGERTLAIDGPTILDWESVLAGLGAALSARSIRYRAVRTEAYFAGWRRIEDRTCTPELAEDPDFARLASVGLRDFFGELPSLRPSAQEVLVVAGPGAALFRHDLLWYADLPKRYAEAAVRRGEARNLGQPTGPFSTGIARRLPRRSLCGSTSRIRSDQPTWMAIPCVEAPHRLPATRCARARPSTPLHGAGTGARSSLASASTNRTRPSATS